MKLAFAALLLLASCARDPVDINLIVRNYEWQCTYRNLWQAPNCIVSSCFLKEEALGKYFWQDRTISNRLVPDENCYQDN